MEVGGTSGLSGECDAVGKLGNFFWVTVSVDFVGFAASRSAGKEKASGASRSLNVLKSSRFASENL